MGHSVRLMEGVRRQIREVLEGEGPNGWLAISVRMVLMERGCLGADLDERSERLCGFVRRYIESTPEVLAGIERAAEERGVLGDVSGVVAAAKAYFTATADFIPDGNGVAGLVDDAYMALSLVERFSAEVRRVDAVGGGDGRGLFELPLGSANAAIRAMIGEPVATQLDGAVSAVLSMADVRGAIESLGARGVRLAVEDPFGGGVEDLMNIGARG